MKMNRKQRRNKEKQMRSSEFKSNLEIERVNKIINKHVRKEKDKLWKENSLDWYILQLWIMHARFGWDGKRLARLHESMTKEFSCFRDGLINIDEAREGLKEIGIEIK